MRPFYEKAVLFQRLVGFKPDLNESIAMMEKSNERKFTSESCIDTLMYC